MATKQKPYRVKITGDHPHRGKIGTADPQKTALGGVLVLVTFDSADPYGEEAAYAHTSELRRV